MILVQMRHLRASRVCASGSRKWMKEHGLSWDEFIETGIDISILEKMDDAIVNRICAIARQEANENGRRK